MEDSHKKSSVPSGTEMHQLSGPESPAFQAWMNAREAAQFYRSDKNCAQYWDQVAANDGGGLQGEEHIFLLLDYLSREQLIGRDRTALDIGCGGGDLTIRLAGLCRQVTAMDYSEQMIKRCQKRCEREGIGNVTFLLRDFQEAEPEETYDCVFSCLNPSTYDPVSLGKMLSLARSCVVYFSMDSEPKAAEQEPNYRGCNSVQFAEDYLKERGFGYRKIPYVYQMQTRDGMTREIPFAFLVIRKMREGNV